MSSHLHALDLRLSHEREGLRLAKTASERELRRVWIAGIEKELAHERTFLGLPATSPVCDISEEELLRELGLG